MNTASLMRVLDEFDRKYGAWLFSTSDFKVIFCDESETCVSVALNRHVTNGIITRITKGLYGNDRAKSKPLYTLEALVSRLKPRDFSYLSLESRLSEEGRISQIPSRLTFMTTGRSQTFKTHYGVIEFVHTEREEEVLKSDTVFDEGRGIYLATIERAVSDLNRTGRNVDLVIGAESRKNQAFKKNKNNDRSNLNEQSI